jgi:tRNA-specific 2-thiouridylase
VVVGPRDALLTRTIELAQVNWLEPAAREEIVCRVKVRSARSPSPARVRRTEGRGAEVELFAGEEAVAPGQACVFYEETGTRVLGGGWIVRAEPARAAA